METYVQQEQLTDNYDTSVPVLKCCIEAASLTGYCPQCLENFTYRNGPYYEGFEHPTDEELLHRVASGKKAWATFARLDIDMELENDITRLGLHMISMDVNKYGVICYEVIKNKELKLSDLADLEKIGKILGVHIPDRLLVEINLDNEPNVNKRIVYGYPFYTLHPYDYLRV